MTAKRVEDGPGKLVFACSGAADVGQLSDLAARRLARTGVGRMYCLAGIGGGVPAIIETTRAAGRILAIDGCPQDCARKSLEKAGFSDFLHLQLADLGLSKGQSSVNPERVDFVVQKATDLLK